MLAALLLALVPPACGGDRHIEVRIPERPWVVALDVPEPNDRLDAGPHWDEKRKEWLLVVGPVGKQSDILMLQTVGEISAGLRTYKDGVPFEALGLRCFEVSGTLGKTEFGNFAAVLEVPDLRVQLKLMRLQAKLPRKEFEGLLKSFRLLLLRRGSARDYPAELGNALMQCAAACPGREAWRKGYMAKHPTDWAAHLAEAEFRRLEKAPPAEQAESYQRALMLLSKVASLKTEERCARALCSEGFGLSSYDAQNFTVAADALELACADLGELKRPELAEVSFELAQAECRAGKPDAALAALARAIEGDGVLRRRAAAEPAFEPLRERPEFQKLIAPPAPAPEKPK